VGVNIFSVDIMLPQWPVYLARLANLSPGPYILLALISFFFFVLIGVQLSQDLPDWFSQSFHCIRGVFTEIYWSELFSIGKLATSFVNMIKISPVTPEITRVTTAHFFDETTKPAYSIEYLGSLVTDLHQLFSFGRHLHEDYKTGISFAVAQGMLLW